MACGYLAAALTVTPASPAAPPLPARPPAVGIALHMLLQQRQQAAAQERRLELLTQWAQVGGWEGAPALAGCWREGACAGAGLGNTRLLSATTRQPLLMLLPSPLLTSPHQPPLPPPPRRQPPARPQKAHRIVKQLQQQWREVIGTMQAAVLESAGEVQALRAESEALRGEVAGVVAALQARVRRLEEGAAAGGLGAGGATSPRPGGGGGA